jgi:hypothetical protein
MIFTDACGDSSSPFRQMGHCSMGMNNNRILTSME